MRRHAGRVLCIALAVIMLVAAFPMSAMAAGVTAKLEYAITGLPNSNAIQKTVICGDGKAGDEIYVIQHQYEGKNSYLSRCVIQKDGKTAKCQDHMILEGFGHAQSLEVFKYNKKTYFFVNSVANDKAASWYWGRQIARIEYCGTKKGESVKSSNYPRLCWLNEAVGSGYGKIDHQKGRIEFALSSNCNRLFIWVQTSAGIYFSYYNTSDINKALDKAGKSAVDIRTLAGKRVAKCVNQTYTNYTKRTKDKSNQGLELTDADNLYVCGGARGTVPEIAKIIKSGSTYKVSSKRTVTSYSGTVKIGTKTYGVQNKYATNTSKGVEIEGLQIKGSKLYFGVCYKDTSHGGIKNGGFIYSVEKSKF